MKYSYVKTAYKTIFLFFFFQDYIIDGRSKKREREGGERHWENIQQKC